MGKLARQTPADRALADRIARARPPACDVGGAYFARCELLARETGQGVADVYEAWGERAAIRQYDAGVSRGEAEQLAFDDVVALYRRQGRLL